MKGVIYKYQSPSGKVYIGQTVDEKKRRKTFLNINMDYAGEKINSARKKYGPENFEYVVLEKLENESIEELANELDKMECYYIGLYNSFKNGYNMAIGGEGSRGYKLTEEHKQKITNYLKNHNPFKGKRHTQRTKDIISEANGKPVKQIDSKTGKVLNRFKSAVEAGKFFGKPRANSEIIKVCKKYISPSGRHYKTALGYKWEYDIEGSTTIEMSPEGETK